MDIKNSEELQNLFKNQPIRHYKKGEIITRADDEPQGLFYLTKGFVRQYNISCNGNELTLQILNSGRVFPIYWAIFDIAGSFYYEAMTPIETLKIDKSVWKKFMEDYPSVVVNLLKPVIQDYIDSLRRIETLVFYDAYLRVVSTILYLNNYFGSNEGNQSVIDFPFTQQDIARFAGLARETTSIEINKLLKDNSISVRNRNIVINDLNKLNSKLNCF